MNAALSCMSVKNDWVHYAAPESKDTRESCRRGRVRGCLHVEGRSGGRAGWRRDLYLHRTCISSWMAWSTSASFDCPLQVTPRVTAQLARNPPLKI